VDNIGEMILTYKKIYMDPFSPQPSQIDVEDIAHALSLMTRANGHFRCFFSVAQHSIHCAQEAKARGEDSRVQLACLLHDAAECYLSDITRPVKRRLPQYVEAERRLQRAIMAAFSLEGLSGRDWGAVEEIDDAMLYHEFLQLADVRLFDSQPVLLGNYTFDFRDMGKVEREFLARYAALREELGCGA
jgi:hypothetical protein